MTFKSDCCGTLRRILAVGLMTAGLSFADSFVTTYEPAGVQTPDIAALCASTSSCVIGTDFDSWIGGGFSTDFGTANTITGTYAGGYDPTPADEWGGAGGAGVYLEDYGSYTLTLTTNGVPGVNYFGLWISSLDIGNSLQFYNGNILVDALSGSDLIASLGACPNPYCGNPNAIFLGQNPSQQYVFVNFFDTNGYFNRIVFSQTVSGGFETDNQTVAYLNPVTPEGFPVVPEPGSLELFVVGGVFLALRATRRNFLLRLELPLE